jgi:hypothetical protein
MILLQLLLVCVAHAEPVDFASAKIVVAADASDMEVFAAREVSRYFRLICGTESPVMRDAGDSPAVFVGVSPEALPRDADGQAYLLRVVSADPPRLRILGRTPVAVQYGVYSLLEKLGVGFYLGGDAIPEQRASILLPSDLNEMGTPIFKIRGSLPWYNFLNSPTTWDLEDYRVFFDQMAKMKMNFVGFHSYDSEPFCAYPENGQWRMGAPAATSMTYGWGTIRHLETKDFGFGTGACFPYDVFGSRSAALATQPKEPTPEGALFPLRTVQDDAIIRAQCVLAQGLQYAKWRGVKVCLGFELVGDPTNPEQRRIEEARIRHTLATYPMLDYVWFWQSEGLGGGSNPAGMDTPLDLIVQRYRPTFEYLGNEKRIAEAARVAAWTQFAYGVVKRLRPDIGVGVSGWGGDRWMRFSDFYVGLDKVLPEDLVFAALDNIDPSWEPNVSAAYGQLSPTREKWPIPWFSSDGGGARRDQWGPQCNVKPFTSLVRDAQAKGCQGILGIHWETRGVEEVAAYVAQFAWNPNLTYEQFYEDFARKCYGEKHGPEMAQVHMRLEALGPRWTGSHGQVECGGFQWFSDAERPKLENLSLLKNIEGRVAAIESDCEAGQARRHLERLRYLRATIRFLLAFDEAALKLTPGGSTEALVTQAEQAKQAGNAAEAERLANQAVQELRATTLGEAMQAYRARLTTQGDCGNLATINTKAYGAFLGLWERAEAALGKDVPLPTVEAGAPVIIMRYPPTARPASGPWEVRAQVISARPLTSVVLRWRGGDGQWGEEPMQRVGKGNTYVASLHKAVLEPLQKAFSETAVKKALKAGRVPWEGLVEPGPSRDVVEYTILATNDARQRAVAPVGAPEATFSCSMLPAPLCTSYGPYFHAGMSMVSWPADPEAPAFLRWTILSPVEYEPTRVLATIGATKLDVEGTYHLAGWPLPQGLAAGGPFDVKYLAGTRAFVQVSQFQDDSWGRAPGRSSVRFAPPDPPAAPSSAKAETAGPYLARVTWDPVAGAETYELHRSAEPNFTPSDRTRVAEWPWTVYDDVGLTSNTTHEWAVVAVNDAGMRSGFTRTYGLFIPDQPLAKPPTGLVATPGPGRITLTWQPSPDRVSGYAVFMRPEAGGGWERVSGAEPLKGEAFVVGGLPDTNPRLFAVRSIDRGGRDGEASAETHGAARPIPVDPVLSIAFDSPKAETGQQGTLGGKATIHDGILDTRQGGWIAFPKEEMLQLAGPLSLEFRINLDQVKGIPVMVSFGHWEGLGYWMQLIGGRIRWYLPVQRFLDAGSTPTGGWHHLCGTYDGRFSRLYMDGKEVGAREVGPVDLTPWPGEFRIGMYSDIDEQFQTHAQFDAVRVYQRALSAEEVAKAAEGRG